jgi:cytochrome c553
MSRRGVLTAALSVFALAPAAQLLSKPAPPPWAYPVAVPAARESDDGIARRLPGSLNTFTLTQIRDTFVAPDWYPQDHPLMPEVVARGRRPTLFACGYCHLPNAQGRPENAPLAGLPSAYIIQQIADYRHGLRKSSEPRMGPPNRMLSVAQSVNDNEVKAAAEYFASLSFKPWIRVLETATVPKTHVAGSMLMALEGAQADGALAEPIGQRIIEVPEDNERTELRDSRSGFIAYVPPGSIKKGERFVTTGSGKTTACATCHGAELKGMGGAPPLAGRSPSYVVRQLYDFQSGARHGVAAQVMNDVVAKLSVDDMVVIAAYTASRTP